MKQHQNNSIRDAFQILATTNPTVQELLDQARTVRMNLEQAKAARARTILIQTRKSLIGRRIRTLKDLVFETFCGDLVPAGQRKRFDLFFQAKERIRELGVQGGRQYEHALTRVRFTWAGNTEAEHLKAFRDAADAILPPLK